MRILHLSDLHLSRYGETGRWSERPNESENEFSKERWEIVHTWKRWNIEGRRDRKGRPDKIRLVDPVGVIHSLKGWPNKNDEKIIQTLTTLAHERHQTSAENLCVNRPSPEDLRAMIHLDERNTNLRFLQIVEHVERLEPEGIVITGDITDNGLGYELVEHYFKPWIDKGSLFAIPGNHDTYDMLPTLGRRERMARKEDQYRAFAERINMEPNASGAFVRRLDDIAIVGLSSCKPPRTPLNATGEVTWGQLVWLRELGRDPAFAQSRLRVCLVHHHLLRMPIELGKGAPLEMGLRLRNATEVMEACVEAGINILLHGHRHHGYMVQLPGCPMVVSSPSSTLGCKSSLKRYAWIINFGADQPYPQFHSLAVDVGDGRGFTG